MKNVLLFAILALSVSVVAAQTKTINLQTNGRTIRGVDASSAFRVDVTKGNTSSAVATIPTKYAANVFLTIDSDGVVKVGLRNMSYNSNHNNEKLQLTVVCPTLEKIDISSAASVTINSDFSVPELDIEASSAGRVGGIGKMSVRNKTGIDCSSASSVKLNIVSSVVEIDASSASKVALIGSTTTLNVEASSSSNVDCYEMAAKNVTAEASSSSSVYVKATGTLRANASSTASIRYDCPESGVTIKEDMLSSVKRR